MDVYLGLDIGGTKILGAVYPCEGGDNPLKRIKKKTKAHLGEDVVIEQIFKVIDELLEEEDYEVKGIGAGSPGIVKNESEVVFSPNIPFQNTNLGFLIEKKYKVPFVLGNDVNVAMYGEWVLRDTGKSKNALGLFLGTGVGGAIIIDKKLYTGQGGAGEIGHMIVNPEGAYCGCGSQGCLESYGSKTGIQNAIRGQLKKGRSSILKDMMEADGSVIKSSSLEKAFEQEDTLAVEVIERAGYYVGLAVGNLVNIFHPDLIILGGGIMEAMGKELLPMIEKEAERHVMPGLLEGVNFELSHLSDDAGIFGAYALIRDKIRD